MGRLNVWLCLLVSLVSVVVFGCLGRCCGLFWWYLRMFEVLVFLGGVSEGSARVGSSQAGANPHFGQTLKGKVVLPDSF